MRKKFLESYKKLLRYTKYNYKKRYCLLFFCFIATSLELLFPLVFFESLSALESNNIKNVIKKLTFLIFSGIGISIINATQNYGWQIYAIEFINNFRNKILSFALKKDMKFYFKDNNYAVQILQDTSFVGSNIITSLPMIFINTYQIFIIMLIIWHKIKLISIIIFILIAIHIYIEYFLDIYDKEYLEKEKNTYIKLVDSIKEYFRGIISIKLYNKESFFKSRLESDSKEYESYFRRTKYKSSAIFGLNEFIKLFVRIIIIFIGIIHLYQNEINILELALVYVYVDMIQEPLNNIIMHYQNMKKVVVFGERLLEFLDEDEIIDVRKKNIIKNVDSIKFKNVSFSYNENTNVINNISFDAKKGDIIGIAGDSGMGKTTLSNLILGIYDDYEGKILINENELNTIERESYFSSIAVFNSKSFLFQGSVKENIIFESNNYINMTQNANIIRANDFIMKRGGFKSRILSGGANLSEKERQKIMLARALCKKSDILILDGTTDIFLEDGLEILDSLIDNFKNTKIIFIATNNMKLLEKCSKIIDLKLRGDI